MAVNRAAWEVVDRFEQALCEYTGAPHCVTVDSCTNALFLAFRLRKIQTQAHHLVLPKHTYAGVAQAAFNAGYEVKFLEQPWEGQYLIYPIKVVDAARRFTSGMFVPGTLQCLSFQATKILPIGRGGAILCDDDEDAKWLRRARFDGREQDVSLYDQQEFQEGYHMYLPPDYAARGLWLMGGIKEHNPDQVAEYPDLSKKRWKR